MMRLFVTTIESIKTPTGQDGFRIILSDGSELAGVRDVTVNATESGVMTAYFAVGGEFKVVTASGHPKAAAARDRSPRQSDTCTICER